MRLADLRKLSVRKQLKIRFRLRNGMECVINEHGVAQIPALRKVPDFNLEDELSAAAEFLLDPVIPEGAKQPPRPRKVGREELASMVAPGPAAGHAEHEEE